MQLLMKYPPIEDIYDLLHLAMYFRDPEVSSSNIFTLPCKQEMRWYKEVYFSVGRIAQTFFVENFTEKDDSTVSALVASHKK